MNFNILTVENIKFDSISNIQMFILLIVFFMIFFLLYLEPKLSKKKLTNKNEHGSSKFSDIKEIKKTFVKENINNIDSVGFPIYYEKKNNKIENVYFDNKSPHFLIIGSTGSGKSVTVVIPECIMFATAKEKHSVVITDPKGEIFRATSKIFQNNGYNVITVDFRNPTKSNKINIMQPIIDEWKKYCDNNKAMLFLLSHFIKNNKIKIEKLDNEKYIEEIKKQFNIEDYIIDIIISNKEELNIKLKDRRFYINKIPNYLKDVTDIKNYLLKKDNKEILNMIRKYQNIGSKHQAESNRLVISLADLIFVEEKTNDKFWINSAKQLFIGIVGIFLEDFYNELITENKINISSIKKFQNSSLIKENQNFLQRNINSRKYGSLSKDYLNSILSAAENTYKSITAIFGEKMAIFDDLNVENVTSTSEFKFTELGTKPTVLYIIVPDEDRAYFQLVTIIIGMLTKDLTKFANLPENKGQLPVMVEWILDEFANCPPLNSIETLVSVARSRKMRFQFFIQSFSQLEQVYGKEISNIIQDNTALCYLKTNTVETANIIANKLGKATIETSSISQSTDQFKIGGNKTTSLLGRELLTSNEIIGLKYKTIIFPTVSNPIFRDTYLYSDIFPKYKDIGYVEREEKILKRISSNYYTVEEMKNKLNSIQEKQTKKKIKNTKSNFDRSINKQLEQVNRNINYNNFININNDLVNYLKNNLFYNYSTQMIKNDNSYKIEIKKLVNNNELIPLEKLDKEQYTICISRNLKKSITNVVVYEDMR